MLPVPEHDTIGTGDAVLCLDEYLELHGLSADVLEQLSYPSGLGRSLKKNLHYFEKDDLLKELFDAADWIESQPALQNVTLDYRIKSAESIISKYERHRQDEQVRKVFNDLLGFRILCTSYESLVQSDSEQFRVVDLSNGKAHDDGYRGIHVYYQLDNTHYPIEIQFNTYYDRQLNDWLHDFVYKKAYPPAVGKALRAQYEAGKIRNETEFQEVMADVLSGRKG